MDYCVVLVTVSSETEATAIARALVEERLAACVNILPPMSSIYRWEGRVEQATEHQLIVKTTAARVDALKREVRFAPHQRTSSARRGMSEKYHSRKSSALLLRHA